MTTDKNGRYGMNTRVSYLGALMVSEPAEFEDAFGVETAAGLADRFIIVPGPDGWKFDHTWEAPVQKRKPCHVKMPKPIMDMLSTVQEEMEAEGKPLRRLVEIAARVAIITASANHDLEVTQDGMRAATEFAKWQQKIRAVYTIGVAENPDARIERIMLEDFKSVLLSDKAGKPKMCEKRPIVRDGVWVSWRLLSKSRSWSKKYSTTTTTRIRRSLIEARMITEYTPEPVDKYDRPKGSNEFRLKGDWTND